jgi:hypothetical protein
MLDRISSLQFGAVRHYDFRRHAVSVCLFLTGLISSRSLCGGVAFERLLRSFETNFWLDADI